MPIPAESIETQRCFLVSTEWGARIRHVVQFLTDGLLEFEERNSDADSQRWRGGVLSVAGFAMTAIRQVPCDWTPEADM